MQLVKNNPGPEELSAFLARSSRQAAIGFGAFCLLLTVIQLVIMLGFLPFSPLRLLLPAVTLGLGIAEFGYAKWGATSAKWAHLLPPMAACEGLLPSFGLTIFGLTLGWETALGSPPLLGYLLVLILGLLRFSPRLILITGAVELAGLLIILLQSVPWQNDGQTMIQYGKLVIIAIGTGVAALVAGQTRGFLERMIAYHAGELRKERELGQRDLLIAILAHDLRTPLNGISGLAEFMQAHPERTKPEELQRYAGEIHQSATQLRSLIDNLLEWARLRTGHLQPSLESIPLREVIEPVLRLSEPALDARGMQWRLEGDGNLEIETDPRLLGTILRNLISNAIKFSPRDSIIQIRMHDSAIEIADSGAGLPDPVLALMRSQPAESPDQPRKGLGLLLSRELAAILAIDLKLENPKEGGVRATLRFTPHESHA